ncbi:MAG: hypothetical protein LBE01_01185 [Deltaproteobacteria bacterium]|nr:hypothetical protein [Deltaproteobacteria bacterium]
MVAPHFNNNTPVVKIASMLCLALSTVYFWWKRHSAEGPEGMKYRKRSRPTGSGRLMSPKQEESIRGLIIGAAPQDHGINHVTWTRRAIAELVYAKFEIRIAE